MTVALSPMPLPTAEPSCDGLLTSEAAYWSHYYQGRDVTYEWSNGRLEEKGVSDHLTFLVCDWLIQLLIEYLRVHPIAERVGLEMGFRLCLPDRVSIRRPDHGLVLHDNPVPVRALDLSYRGVLDLCIECLSISSRAVRERDTVVKKAEYAAAGVREYYLLHHRPALRAFYRLSELGRYEPIEPTSDGILVSTLLPGFRWRLSDLDRRPALEVLVGDPVYRDFVLVGYQRERERAERLAARLRALGLDPDEDAPRPSPG